MSRWKLLQSFFPKSRIHPFIDYNKIQACIFHCPQGIMTWMLLPWIWHGQSITSECSPNHHQKINPPNPAGSKHLRSFSFPHVAIIGITIHWEIQAPKSMNYLCFQVAPSSVTFSESCLFCPPPHESTSVIITLVQATITFLLGLFSYIWSHPSPCLLHRAAWLILKSKNQTRSFLLKDSPVTLE